MRNSPISDAARVIADAVFPRRCPVCDNAVYPFGDDVCEDCGIEPEELPFSEEVKDAVKRLTKPAGFEKTEKDKTLYYDGIIGNKIAVMVKLLDRCNNISSMAASFSDKHMAEYILETQEYISPLMEKARDEYPEYSNQLFLIRYHMNSVLAALRHHMRSSL